MAYMKDLPVSEQTLLTDLPCPEFESPAWVRPPPLAEQRVALVNTAGLMRRGDRPVGAGDARYRAFDASMPINDLLMSHASVNFDRTAFQQDLNCVVPWDRMHELVDDGVIGALHTKMYSFMGATDPQKMMPHARTLAAELKSANVDSALLIPV